MTSFLPDDLPTVCRRGVYFVVDGDLLPELRSKINHDRPAEFVDRHSGERVWLTIAAVGRCLSIHFEADDGKPMAEPSRF